ncbi:unnamed protein product, partial [Closterium sp. NIES-53]
FANDINSAQRAWAYMEAVYLGRTDTNLTAMRKKLLLLAMEPMEKIIDYVNRAKSYNDGLTAMGAPESEKHVMGYIISGLPKEWTAEIGILTCNTPKDLTQLLETLQALELVKPDLKRREAVATVAEENRPANLNAIATPRIVDSCYHCGKKGHKAADCYSNPNASDCYNNKASRNYIGKELQQKPAAAKTNVMDVPAAVEVTTKVDAILGGAHKANVARASEVCLLSKGFKEKAWFMDSGNGCKTFSDNGKLWVFGPDWQLLAEGAWTQGLYQMKLKEQDSREDKVTYQPEPEKGKKAQEELRTMLENTAVTELQQLKLPLAAAAEAVDINLLHKRVGHANTQRIKEIMKKNMAAGVKVTGAEETHMKCDSCVEGKATKAPHPRHGPKEPYGAMEVVATDVCVLRSDNGGEFINKDFNDYLKAKGIRRHRNIPHTPQHNSIAERVNRTLLNSVRSMLADSKLPLTYWGDALGMACWLKNRLPTKGLAAEMTPHEAFYKRKPNLKFLRVWGCMTQYSPPAGANHKLLPRARWGVHLGTCPESKGWIIKDVETGIVLATRDVTFYENLNYVDWKASNKGTTPGTAPATPQRAEELLEDAQNEGLGTANNEGEEDEEEHTQAGVDWVWEPTEDKLDNSDMEAAPTTPLLPKSASDIDGDIGEDEAEQADQSSTERKSDPWDFFETINNDKGAAEIDNLLQDGAILIGREEGGTSTEKAGEMAADTGTSDASVKGEELGRGKRTKKPNLKYQQVLMTCWKDVHTHLLLTSTATALITKEKRETYKLPQEPLTIEEALSGPYKEKWKAAIQEELDALAERGTWKLVQMPEGRHAVGVKWIFKIKTGDKGQLERFKARLVAKGYTQVEGIDYTETYALRRGDTKNLLKQGNEVQSRLHSASSTSISRVNSSISSSSSASRASASSTSANSSRLRRVSNSSSPNTSGPGSSSTPSTSTSRTSSCSTFGTTSSSSNSCTSSSRVSSSRVSNSGSSTLKADALSKPLAQLLRGERLRPGRQSWWSTRRTSRRSSTPQLSTPRLRTLRHSTPRLHTLRLSTPRLNIRRLNTPKLSTPRPGTLRLRTLRLRTPRPGTRRPRTPMHRTPRLRTPRCSTPRRSTSSST